jgi:hypothetical protein
VGRTLWLEDGSVVYNCCWSSPAQSFLGPSSAGLVIFPISKSMLCYDRRSVDQSVLVSSTHLGLTTRFLLLSGSCGFVDVGRSLWREDGSVVYNCCWTSPVILGSESRGSSDHILLPQIRESPNLEGQFTVFISPRNKVAHFEPQTLGSLFFASYDSQGYGGRYSNLRRRGVLNRFSLYRARTDNTEINSRDR